jgi:hypothetical protein
MPVNDKAERAKDMLKAAGLDLGWILGETR